MGYAILVFHLGRRFKLSLSWLIEPFPPHGNIAVPKKNFLLLFFANYESTKILITK